MAAPAPGLFYVGTEPFPRQCICSVFAKTVPAGTPHIVNRKEDWVFHALRTRLDSIPDDATRNEEIKKMKGLFTASKAAKKAQATAQFSTSRGGFDPNDKSTGGYVPPSIINLSPPPPTMPIGVLPSPPISANQWGPGYPGIHQQTASPGYPPQQTQSPGYAPQQTTPGYPPQQQYYPPPPPGPPGPPGQYNPQPTYTYTPNQPTYSPGLYSPPYSPPAPTGGSAASFYSSPTPQSAYTPPPSAALTSPPPPTEGHTDRAFGLGKLKSHGTSSSLSGSFSGLFGSKSSSGSGDKDESSEGIGKLVFKGLKLAKKAYSHSSSGGGSGSGSGGHEDQAAASEDQASGGGEDYSAYGGGEEAYVDPVGAFEGVSVTEEDASGFWEFLSMFGE